MDQLSAGPISSCSDSEFSMSLPSETQFDHSQIVVVKKIAQGKVPVVLAFHSSLKLHFAMKVFLYSDDSTPSSSFLNESRFLNLNHPYILSSFTSNKDSQFSYKNTIVKASYLLSEYLQNGDLFDLLITSGITISQILARTYFHQLTEGIEYLHANGIAHLDLKLENVMIGPQSEIKIIDFDQAYQSGDPKVRGKGTQYYRAPELKNGVCKQPFAADIYSLGIILFILVSGGKFPHTEDKAFKGVNLYRLLFDSPEEFWEKHSKLGDHTDHFDNDLKALFCWMTKFDPSERPNFTQIKESKWYCGEVFTPEELTKYIKSISK